MGMKPIKLNNSLTVNGHHTKHACLHVQQPFHFSMEMKFKLTTKPVIKASIAIIACMSIAYLITKAQNAFRLAGVIIIGSVAIVLGTYRMPPLCAIAMTKSTKKSTQKHWYVHLQQPKSFPNV
jgi:hypothetical protein